MRYGNVQHSVSRRALYESIVHQPGETVQDNRKGLVRRPWAVARVRHVARLMRATVGGVKKNLLKVSRELGVSTWGIDTPRDRNLGDKPPSRSWHTLDESVTWSAKLRAWRE